MADESREDRIKRLKEEIKKLLEEKFPEKGSTIDEIERIAFGLGGWNDADPSTASQA